MAPGDCFTIEVRNRNFTDATLLTFSTTSRLAVNHQPIILQRFHSEETGIFLWMDGWTASTDNTARGAVFEHTVMITENGVDILTA
jgi:methionine aminopeptidase